MVCLGGSAGGLDAYTRILRDLPANSGMAFVVAPHRSFEHADLLPQILAEATAMPVVDVKQGMILKPDMVFVMPPGQDMTVNDNDVFDLKTTVKPRVGWPRTIKLVPAFSRRSVWKPRRGRDSLRYGPRWQRGAEGNQSRRRHHVRTIRRRF